MNVARPLELSAFYFPDRVTLIFKDRRWTYRELDMEASALASSGPSPKRFKLVEQMSQCRELTRAFRFVFR